MGRLTKAIEMKRKKLEELKEIVEDVRKAEEDWHARREPRDCGITVHPGIGCDLGCVYCYIADMGFPTDKVEPYPLSGPELALALMLNPNVAPGPTGTYVAVGSVTEPFHPLLLDKTFEYLKWLKYLGNYTQMSFKMVFPERRLNEFLESSERRLSVLVSVSSLRRARELEPRLPPVEKRFELAKKIKDGGKGVAVFIRPIIPGITDKESKELLELASSYGLEDVVLGGLRVTQRIMKNLRSLGVSLEGRLRRLPRGREQVYVYTRDLRDKIAREAESLGMRVLYTACDANARHHGEVCWDSCIFERELCERLPPVDPRDLREGVEMLGGKLVSFELKEPVLKVEAEGLKKNAGWIIQMAYRRQVILKVGGRTFYYK
ncbi:radical SAM protein [Ignicoccus hospitalis]|uniref:Radical SAM domain protein n=1 Tax=Ignicoccus hospitalis (strain KIN4/I / DSM 18386 / JCM 14125) TaxID=453591 RepID=A8A981_IGNH4|nr:radical SAM protein [Ignicoccus hospitalis]ABU81483.1 Radical SAM domain protein [Ignicoccus hospitalis KIN4/I]HIH90209.1 radical SAM protein [Desulfurococcaceae archaeon]